MALNTEVPAWLANSQTGWLQSAAASGARAIDSGFAQGVRMRQFRQQMELALAKAAVDAQSAQTLHSMRLQQLADRKAQVNDLAKLQAYARGEIEGVPDFESPSSYSKLSTIDLARSRSELGKQTAADLTDFNRRLAKVSAEDRVLISDLQKAGRPASEVWSVLGQAEARQRERLAAEKVYAPSDVRKLLDEANEAEMSGDTETADLLRQRARTLSRGGRESSIQNLKLSDVDRYKLGDIRSRLNTVTRSLGDPKGVMRFPEEKQALEQEKLALEQQQATILKRYESSTPTEERPDVVASREGRTFAVPVSRPGGPPMVQSQKDIDEAIRQGNEAIRRGKDPAAVRELLREMGVPITE